MELDPDGYTLRVGDSVFTTGISGTVFVTLPAATIPVSLTDLAANCVATSSPPPQVALVANDTVIVAFAVHCVATTGTLRIQVTTSGTELDPDGYTLMVGDSLFTTGISDTVFVTLPAATIPVSLSNLASNCAVTSSPPAQVALIPNDTVRVAFMVDCIATTGTLRIQITSTGRRLDPDGYTLSIDASPARPVEINDTILVDHVPPGPHSVALNGVRDNCTAAYSPLTTVLAGTATTLDIAVICRLTLAHSIVFVSSDSGVREVFLMEPDGTHRERVTVDLSHKASPSVGPDGRLVFIRLDGTWRVAAADGDGANIRNLTAGTQLESTPRISPDGSRIAFSRSDSAGPRLWTMAPDGSNPSPLLIPSTICCDGPPAWDPASSLILFAHDGTLATVRPDGTQFQVLPVSGIVVQSASFSPDGTRIAFAGTVGNAIELFAINSDGSSLAPLTTSGFQNWAPTWSPDGASILYYRFLDTLPLRAHIMKLDLATMEEVDLSPSMSSDGDPVWVP
jgi:TolB protein